MIKRDFEEKAPDRDGHRRAGGGAGVQEPLRAPAGSRPEPLLGQPLRHDHVRKRPTRWRDVPRSRDDVFLPVFRPWDGGELIARHRGRLPRAPAHVGRGDGGRRSSARSSTSSATRRARAPSCRRSSRRWPRSSRIRRASPITSSPTTPTTRATATTTSSSARIPCPSSRRCSGRPWSCTTSTLGPREDAADRGRPAPRRRLRGRVPPAERRGACSSSAGSRVGAYPPAQARARRDASARRAAPAGGGPRAVRVQPRLEALAVYRASAPAPTTTSSETRRGAGHR